MTKIKSKRIQIPAIPQKRQPPQTQGTPVTTPEIPEAPAVPEVVSTPAAEASVVETTVTEAAIAVEGEAAAVEVKDVIIEEPLGEQAPAVIDGGVQDESMPAVNVNTEMPQESDPVGDGSLEEMLDNTPNGLTDAVTPATAEPAVEKPAVQQTEEEAYLAAVAVTGTETQKRILAAVETFCNQMRPKMPISPEQGVKFQFEFLGHLLWLLKKDYDDFRGGWNALLVYFAVNHGTPTIANYSALSEPSATRFLNSWTKGNDTCMAYRNLITLLRATRFKETRKHDIKTINLSAIAPELLTEKELGNLKKFYAV